MPPIQSQKFFTFSFLVRNCETWVRCGADFRSVKKISPGASLPGSMPGARAVFIRMAERFIRANCSRPIKPRVSIVKLLRLRVRSRAWFRIKEPKQTVSLSQSFQHPKSCLFTCTLPACPLRCKKTGILIIAAGEFFLYSLVATEIPARSIEKAQRP